jgi:hypothetical protein
VRPPFLKLQEKLLAKPRKFGKGSVRTWTILALSLGLQISGYAAEDNLRTFRAVDPDLLDAKVPHGFGKIFVSHHGAIWNP